MRRRDVDTREGTAPVGLIWRITAPITARSRRRKFDLFMQEVGARQGMRVLDVGAGDSVERSVNYLESWYPWPEDLVICSYTPVPALQSVRPDLAYVYGDGRKLPFADHAFDVGFANAVIEHVGTRESQRLFVAEMVRTCRTVFLTTPNRWFPVDPHTLYPFAHWLPAKMRAAIYRRGGKEFWADELNLNPLGVAQFGRLFPTGHAPRLIRQRLLGWTATVVAVVRQ